MATTQTAEINKYEEEVFKLVIKPMTIWIVITSLTTAFFYLLCDISNPTYPHFTINPNIGLSQKQIGFIAICLLLSLVFLPIVFGRAKEWFFLSIVFLTSCLMGVIILLTGGILDSPFSGAFALFNVSFITLQQTREYTKFNWLLILFSLLLIFLPYWLFANDNIVTSQNVGKVYLVNWQQNWFVTNWRIIINILILLGTGYTSKYIGDRINQLWDGVKDKNNA
jgi:hypothetical protein